MNPVFNYLNKSRGIKFGVRKMSKSLGLSKRKIFYFCHKDNRIRRVTGEEIGSGKHITSVFTIDV